MEAAQSALDRLDEMENEGRASESQLKRLRDLYRARFRMCQAVLGGEDPEAAAREQKIADYGAPAPRADRDRARGTAHPARRRPPAPRNAAT